MDPLTKSITNVFPSGSTDRSLDGNINKDLIKNVVVLRNIVE